MGPNRARRTLKWNVRAGLVLGLGMATVALGSASCSRRALVTNPFPDLPATRIGEVLPPEACKADLNELFDLVERTSPNPYLGRDRAAVRADFDRLIGSIDGPMDRRRFAGIVREACAAYRNAHQYTDGAPEDFNAWRAAGGRSPSFALSPSGDELRITSSTDDRLARGGSLVRLNGISGSDLLTTFRRRTPAETPAYRDHLVQSLVTRHLWELGFEGPYTLEFRDEAGSVWTLVDEGKVPPPVLTFAQRFAKLNDSGPNDKSAASSPKPFSLSWPAPKVAMIDWRVMDPISGDAWEAFLQSTFTELEKNGAEGLIVDLRNNSGGSSERARPLLGYLTDTPVRFASGKRWRKSAEYDAFLSSCVVWWGRGLPWRSIFSKDYAQMALGETRVFEGGAKPPPALSPRFRGRTAFLIGPGTFSSATMLADAVATHGLGALVGRPTGGVPNMLGEIGFTRLPSSGMIVSFCSAQTVRANGDATDPSPVMPTIPVPDRAFGNPNPGRLSPDPDVDAALRWIAEPSAPAAPASGRAAYAR